MNNFAVVSDSACDLPAALIKKHDIGIVRFKVSFDKVHKLTEGVDITLDDFYNKLAESDAVPKTYFPTVKDYVKEFKKYLEQGQDILCLCLSSKLSKSYNSAMNAQKILSQTYPYNEIMIVDTLSATAGQGLLVLDAVKLSETMDAQAAFNKLLEIKKTSFVICTVASLNQLARGGRISAGAAAFGSFLKINPILYLTEGALHAKDKAIGRAKAIDKVIRLAIKEIGDMSKNYDFITLHARAPEEAKAIASAVKSSTGATEVIPPVDLGITIGMHTGEPVAAVAFAKKI